MSLLPGPLEIIVIGNPICFSTNSTYFLQFSGRSSYFFDSTDIAFPSRKLLNNRFCFLKLHSCREFCCYLSVDLIACANRDLIQISQNIQYCKSNVCSSLETASVFGCNTVEPSHTSRTACSSTELTTVTATFSQLICFLAEDLRNECTCSNCTGVSFAYGYDLLDLIWSRPAPMAP